MSNPNPLEVTVREAEPLYRRIAKGCYHSPVVRRGVVLGAAVAAAAAGVYFLPSSEVTGETARQYGFSEGIMDGALSPFNAVLSTFKDSTAAQDGTGIISRPADGYYSLGFGTGSLIWVLGISIIVDMLRHSKKAKN